MALRKDKQKVLGEVFDNERILTFLNYAPPEGVDADFHVLEKAYRGMKAENFATFLKFFTDAGRNLNATNTHGQSIMDIISTHERSQDYVSALREYLTQ